MQTDRDVSSAGRSLAPRRDSRYTRQRLVDGVGTFTASNGRPPSNLSEVAKHVGVSTATAYRHFASLDDLANAHLERVPSDAIERFHRRRLRSADPDRVLTAWNRAWVSACLEHADTAVPLRSPKGFLARRRDGDPLVGFVCDTVAPLLAACDVPEDVGLAVWNVISDPREVVDLNTTLSWSAERIARHVTTLTLAVRNS